MRFRPEEDPADLGHLIFMLDQLRQLLGHIRAAMIILITGLLLKIYMLF